MQYVSIISIQCYDKKTNFVSNAGDLPKISLEHKWTTHTLFGATPAEARTCCWNRHDSSSSLLLSSADNGTLTSWDLRSASAFGTNKRKPVWFVGEEEFAAGVTTLSWHPTEERVFAVESCDESVRVYDIRVMSSGGRGRGWLILCWGGSGVVVECGGLSGTRRRRSVCSLGLCTEGVVFEMLMEWVVIL